MNYMKELQGTDEVYPYREECVKTDEYTRYRYVFESEKGCFVPCYLLLPLSDFERKTVIQIANTVV